MKNWLDKNLIILLTGIILYIIIRKIKKITLFFIIGKFCDYVPGILLFADEMLVVLSCMYEGFFNNKLTLTCYTSNSCKMPGSSVDDNSTNEIINHLMKSNSEESNGNNEERLTFLDSDSSEDSDNPDHEEIPRSNVEETSPENVTNVNVVDRPTTQSSLGVVESRFSDTDPSSATVESPVSTDRRPSVTFNLPEGIREPTDSPSFYHERPLEERSKRFTRRASDGDSLKALRSAPVTPIDPVPRRELPTLTSEVLNRLRDSTVGNTSSPIESRDTGLTRLSTYSFTAPSINIESENGSPVGPTESNRLENSRTNIAPGRENVTNSTTPAVSPTVANLARNSATDSLPSPRVVLDISNRTEGGTIPIALERDNTNPRNQE